MIFNAIVKKVEVIATASGDKQVKVLLVADDDADAALAIVGVPADQQARVTIEPIE